MMKNFHSNELQALVSDLHTIGVSIAFTPVDDDLFHFRIELNNKGIKTKFVNHYNIDQLQDVMKTAYIHFHKKLHWDTRNYDLAKAVELPPETYFLNADEFGIYPPTARLYLGFEKPWFYTINQERNLSSYLPDIRNGELLGHLSGWFQMHSEDECRKYRKELESLLKLNEL